MFPFQLFLEFSDLHYAGPEAAKLYMYLKCGHHVVAIVTDV